ncbi:MAG: VTT domain-containing protein, partial [Candidatus Micrarchaeia archaeon]
LGSCINYYLGLKIGKGIYKKFGRKRVKGAIKFFNKYGFYSLIIAALTPIPWDLFSLLSGFLHYDFKKYMLASLIGRIPRFLIVAIIGSEALKWLALAF